MSAAGRGPRRSEGRSAPPGRPEPARRGRPRCEESRASILASTLARLERGGLAAATMDAIAADAGVSKATLYRWWPSRGHVILEALLGHFEKEAAFADTGTLAGDLRFQIRALVRLFGATPAGGYVAAIVSEAQHDPDLARGFRETFLAKRRASARAVLERAVERGEIESGVDPELLLDLLYAPIYLRLLLGHAPLDETFADALVALALPAVVRPA